MTNHRNFAASANKHSTSAILPQADAPVKLDGLDDEWAALMAGSEVEPQAGTEGEPVIKPRFTPMSLADLRNLPPKEWVIDQVLGRGDLAMVYGGPGTGKTFVVLDFIFSACLARPFAERFAVPRPLNVAYTAGEGVSGLAARFAAAADYYGVDDLPNFTFFAETPQLYSDNGAYANVGDFVREWKERQDRGEAGPLDILIIDTLHSATTGADENSSQHMGIVLQAAKQAIQALGCAVILIHHTNKAGSAERGSSALRGAMDAMIEIRRVSENDTGTKAVMSCAKLKDGQAWKPQTFDLVVYGESVRVFWDEPSEDGTNKAHDEEDRKAMLDFMRAQPGVRLTAKILAEKAGIQQYKAIRLLSKMAGNGDCKSALMYGDRPNSNRNPLTYFVA